MANSCNAIRLMDGNRILHYWWHNDLEVQLSQGLNDGKWHHVAATYDGTTRMIWVNGLLLAQDNPAPPDVEGTDNFCIGSSNSNGVFADEYFKGDIRNVKIWRKALSFSKGGLLYLWPPWIPPSYLSPFQESVV